MATVTSDGSGYFLYHSIGMFPGKDERIADALARVATLWGTPNDAQWPQSLEIRQKFIARWSDLIGAPTGTVTTAENVTTALYSIIGSLPDRWLHGRKLLIAADCFPSLHFLLAGMAERRGFEIDTVPMRPGEYWVRDEDFIARWTSDVGVALLTWVTSTASHRCDLRALVEHGRAMVSVVGVDITQGVGIIPFDVRAADADFVVGSTLKWLCGVAGAGVLQVRERCCTNAVPNCAAGSARRILSPGHSTHLSTRPTRGGSITARLRYLPAPRACLRWIGTLNKMPQSCKPTIDHWSRRLLMDALGWGSSWLVRQNRKNGAAA